MIRRRLSHCHAFGPRPSQTAGFTLIEVLVVITIMVLLVPGFDPYGPDETGTDIVVYFSPVEMRHEGRGNVVFLDGHVESLTLEELGYVVKKDAPTLNNLPPTQQNGVALPQPTSLTTLSLATPWGNNRLFNGVGYDETSPSYQQALNW